MGLRRATGRRRTSAEIIYFLYVYTLESELPTPVKPEQSIRVLNISCKATSPLALRGIWEQLCCKP